MNRLVVLFVIGMLLVSAEGKSKKEGTLDGRKLTGLSKMLGRDHTDEWCETGVCDDDDECDEYCVHELHYEYGHCEGDNECCCGPA